VSYLNRNTNSRRTAGSPELLYLLIVLVAGVGTAWFASQKIGTDFSSITTVASVLGLGQTAHPLRYDPRTSAQPSNIQVLAPSDDVVAEGTAAPTTAAPYCQDGQSPTFTLGLAELKAQLGDTMGQPVECEHVTSGSGDTLQQTSTGLAAYIKRSNTVTFTDGWRHWALTARGVTTWEGAQSEPPAA
jgi:hypothetical protein